MGFKNFEEYEEYLRQQIFTPKKSAEIIKKGDAKVRTAQVEIQKEKAETEPVSVPKSLAKTATHKVTTVQDEYGTTHTKYLKAKTTGELLTEQLRKEIMHCGDLKVIKNNHSVIIPKEFFDLSGALLPSKRSEYDTIIATLEALANV